MRRLDPDDGILWTVDQVANLRYLQAVSARPYVCDRAGGTCTGVRLVPTQTGWRCPSCSHPSTFARPEDLAGEILHDQADGRD